MSLSGHDYADIGDDCILHDYMFHTPYDGEEEYYIPLGYAMVYNHSASPNAEWDIEEEEMNALLGFMPLEILNKAKKYYTTTAKIIGKAEMPRLNDGKSL